MNQVVEYSVKYGVPALAVVGFICAALAVISPLTKTKLDDKLFGVFTKIRDILAWIVAKGQTAGTVVAVAQQKPGVVAKMSEKILDAKK